MRQILILVFLAVAFQVQAQEPAAPETAAPTAAPAKPATAPEKLDTNKDGVVDGDEAVAATEGEATVGETLDEINETVGAAKGLSKVKDAEGWHAKLMIIAAFLAALFKLLLSGIKLIKAQTKWFEKKKAKRILKYSTLGLGALAGLASNIVFGLPIMDCIVIFMSGPVAVAIHEYTKDSKDTAEEKPA